MPTPLTNLLKPPNRPGAEVTAILLNWHKPEQVARVIESLAAQTVDVSIILWDNAVGYHVYPDDVRLDLHIRAGRNLGCFPRWWLASSCETPYVCCVDDDLLLGDVDVLKDAIEASKQNDDEGVVGMFGWTWVPGKNYRNGKHYMYGVGEDTYVDVVKGRFMLFATPLMQRVPCYGVGRAISDDLHINLSISRGQKNINLLPATLSKRWKNMSQRGLASLGGHYQIRWEVVQQLMKEYGPEGMTRYMAPEGC